MEFKSKILIYCRCRRQNTDVVSKPTVRLALDFGKIDDMLYVTLIFCFRVSLIHCYTKQKVQTYKLKPERFVCIQYCVM